MAVNPLPVVADHPVCKRSAANRDWCFRTRSRRLTRVGGLLSQLPNHWCWHDLGKAEIAERVAAALTMVGLEPATFLNRYPVDLSGGQAQRVVIARAIINEPKVILADEPMSAIDVAARIQILDTFAAIRETRRETALIMVSHDLGVVQHIADRILVLHDGRVEEEGSTAEVLGGPQSDYTRQLIEAASL